MCECEALHRMRCNEALDRNDAASQQLRPFVLYKPSIMRDGDAFIVLLGDDLQCGIVGCGDTPDAAARDFDKAWFSKARK